MVGAGDRAVRQLVIERARENARRRGFADAAHAGEDPGLRNAAGLERVRDRAHHGVLTDQVVEGRRPVFARQNAVGSGWCCRVVHCSDQISPDRAQRNPGAAYERLDRPGFRSAQSGLTNPRCEGWEADERPEPRSLGLLPSGPDPVGEWLVHRQPPGPISAAGGGKASQPGGRHARLCGNQARGGNVRGRVVPSPSAATLIPFRSCDLALSRLLVMNDADFPWLILVPRRVGASELIDLGLEQAALIGEISRVIACAQGGDRMRQTNVAAIGNVVPQLHIHIVARRKDDPLWPKPVWGAAAGRADQGEMARFAMPSGAGSACRNCASVAPRHCISGRHRIRRATRPGMRCCRCRNARARQTDIALNCAQRRGEMVFLGAGA